MEVFLAKLNIPLEEVDTFTSQIKERNMGELFAHFEGWDVQAIRKEAREEAQILARKQVESEIAEACKQVTQQVTQQITEQVTESDIQKLLAVLHKLDCSRKTAIEQLAEQYQLSYEIAAKKVDDFWERS